MKNHELKPDQLGAKTIQQFCYEYNVSRPWVYKHINEGNLKTVKVGHIRRILPEHEFEFWRRDSSMNQP
jgi:hypothetical protein